MKAVGIIGYKKTGKTSLLVALARELGGRGHRIATVKHTSGAFDLPDTDTARHRASAPQVAAVCAEESVLFLSGERGLGEILLYLNADLVLVEGFKADKSLPKIVCLSGGSEDEALFDGLVLCAVGKGRTTASLPVPLFDTDDELSRIADLVEQKAFKLPGLNCGECGYEDCYGLARAIVSGEKAVDDCVSLNPVTEVRIDGRLMPMRPFVAEIVGSTIRGMLSTLRGFTEGEIEIRLSAPIRRR